MLCEGFLVDDQVARKKRPLSRAVTRHPALSARSLDRSDSARSPLSFVRTSSTSPLCVNESRASFECGREAVVIEDAEKYRMAARPYTEGRCGLLVL